MTRDEMIKECKRIVVALEELHEEIQGAAAEAKTRWTPFDVERTTRDLRTAARLTNDVGSKIGQVGAWTKH